MLDLSLREHEEAIIVERAIKFAYTPADSRTLRSLCHECWVIWPHSRYELRIKRWMGGWIPSAQRVTQVGATARARMLRELDHIRRDLQRSIELAADSLAGEDAALATAPIHQARVIAELTESEGFLPAGVLAAYAVALVLDRSLPWGKRIKRCSGCGQVFLPRPTGGRAPNSHPECRRKARANYMTEYRDSRAEK